MSDFIADIRNRLESQSIANALRIAAVDVLADSSDRIFEQGKDSNGNLIGSYSTKPIYISKKNSPKVVGDVKKTTMFFPGGYKQFKQELKGTPKVNLTVFGRLRNDYKTAKETITGNSIEYSLKENENANKKEWAEEHFKTDIFSLTNEEIETVTNTFGFEILRMIKS